MNGCLQSGDQHDHFKEVVRKNQSLNIDMYTDGMILVAMWYKNHTQFP